MSRTPRPAPSPALAPPSPLPQHYCDAPHDLRDLVQSALARSFHFAGRGIRVELDGDAVVLRGTVRSYYQKQVAQESVRSIDGVRRIRNELEVIAT